MITNLYNRKLGFGEMFTVSRRKEFAMNLKSSITLVLLLLCAGCKSISPEEYMDQSELNVYWGEVARKNFAETLKKGGRSPAHDFVSQYDFTNAALEDLPWGLHKLCVSGREYFDYCKTVRKKNPKWNYLEFNFPAPEPRHYERVDKATCRLTDGIFIGELVVSDGTVFAASNNYSDGFKIYKVGFTDVNHDGFMDAVLWLVQQGYGSATVSDVYVLTRKQPGTKFSQVSRRK